MSPWARITLPALLLLSAAAARTQEVAMPDAPPVVFQGRLNLETVLRTTTLSYRASPGPGVELGQDHSWGEGLTRLSWDGEHLPLGLSFHGVYAAAATTSPAGRPDAPDPDKVDFQGKAEELGLAWQAFPGLFIDLGKKKIEAGAGLFMAPSDLFGFRESAADDNDSLIREGLIGVDLKWLTAFGGLRYFYAPVFDPDDDLSTALGSPQTSWGHTLMFGSRLGPADFALLASRAGEKGEAGDWRFGANASWLPADAWVLRLDAALTQTATLAVVESVEPLTLREEELRWFPRVSVNLEYDPTDSITLMAEYYYNRQGLSGDDLDRALDLERLNNQTGSVAFSPAAAYGAFGLARHYLMERYTQDLGDGLTVEAVNAHNLQDGSGVASVRTAKTFDALIVSFRTRAYYGPDRSEFGAGPALWDGTLELRVFLR